MTVLPRQADDQFIVLACDGIWDVMEPDVAWEIATRVGKKRGEWDLAAAAAALLKSRTTVTQLDLQLNDFGNEGAEAVATALCQRTLEMKPRPQTFGFHHASAVSQPVGTGGVWPFVLVPRLYHGKAPPDRWDMGGRLGISLILCKKKR